MSQETQSSPVQLVTAAYLKEVETQEQAEQVASKQDSTLVALTWFTRAVSFVIVGALIVGGAFGVMSASSNIAKEKHRRTCGLDWVLWLGGSDSTFQSRLEESMEKSRREIQFELDKAERKWEFNGFDSSQLLMGNMVNGGQE
jgi:hypothetical protein